MTSISLYNPFDEENKVMDDNEDFISYIKQRFDWTHQFFMLDSDITPEYKKYFKILNKIGLKGDKFVVLCRWTE